MIFVADIGGSHMRVAMSDANGSLEEPLICDTPADFDTGVAIFAKMTRDTARGRPITGGVVGIAGLLSANRRVLLKAPHLRKWEGEYSRGVQ